MRAGWGRRRDSEPARGQALVEFSLVIPLVLLLIFALIDFGRLVYIQNAMSQAAREGARYGSVQARSGTDVPAIVAWTESRLPGLEGATATVSCIRPGTLVPQCRQGDTLEVVLSYDVEMITPVIGQVMAAAGLNPIGLESTSQVLVNN
jgi:hypothetical protein